jgi:hypothetical protein
MWREHLEDRGSVTQNQSAEEQRVADADDPPPPPQ